MIRDNTPNKSTGRHPGNATGHADWCPVLPAARDVLPAVMVHTEGVGKALQWLKEQYQAATSSTQQQPAGGKGRRKGGVSATPAGDRQQQLSVDAVNGFLNAALELSAAAKGAGDMSEAAGIAKEVVHAANEWFNYPVAAAHLVAAGQYKPGGSSSSSSSSSGSLLPNVTSYSLLLNLHGAAGEFQCVSDLVMAAVRGQLPLGGQQQQQQTEVWSPPAVEVLLSAAADVWLAAGAADVAVSLLDGLLVAGGRDITQQTLAAAMLEAADKGQEQVRKGRQFRHFLVDTYPLFDALHSRLFNRIYLLS